MMFYENVIISVVFFILGIIFLLRYMHGKGHVIIKEKSHQFLNGFLICMCFLSAAMLVINYQNNTILDYVRVAITLFLTFIFLMTHDGIGDEGIVFTGKLFPWNEIKAYDTEGIKKTFHVYFIVTNKDDVEKTKDLAFDIVDEDDVKKMLEKHIHNKYRRLKRQK